MMSGLITVGYFLFNLIFSFAAFILLVRLALRYFRVSSLHPISQAINKTTNPIVMPLDKVFITNKTPTKKPRLSRYDWACFCVLVLIELLKFAGIDLLFLGAKLPWALIPLYVLADLIVQSCNLLFYALIIRVVMSWVNPMWQHPISDILRLITDPLLRLGRRVIPDISGFDFSPYLVLVILKVITLFISAEMPYHLI
jgi:YggT family protein